MDNKKNIIRISDENGREKEFEVIAYINNDVGNYVVYTDNRVLDNDNVAMYVSALVIGEDGSFTFEEVSDEEIKDVISKIQERVN